MSEHLLPKVEEQIKWQANIFQTNPVDFQLNTLRLFTNPPRRIPGENIELPVQASIAIDLESNLQLFEKNSNQALPIASITKLMTALVWLDHNPGWKTEYEVVAEDRREGGRIRLYNGDHLTAKDLFFASLVGSENTAITGLVNLTGLTEEEFVAEMNLKAQELRMYNTKFVDPTGLSPANTAPARDVFKLAKIALQKPEIRETVLTKEYKFKTKEGKEKIFSSTDDLLGEMPEDFTILGGKTGYLQEGGYSFVGLFEKDEHEIITVVLGAEDRWQRFTQTELLLKWIFQSHLWPQDEL
ncbi:MAG: serine hydrolase [bacterium]